MTADLLAWLIAHAALAALVFARTAGLAWTAPVLAAPGLDARYRLLLAACLGLIVAPAVVAAGAGAEAGMLEPGWAAVGRACVVEALVGAALGWTAALVVAGARQAGDVVASQAGLSSAALFDAEAGEDVTALGHLYGLVALGVFLALDGPLALVRALVESYRVIPAGGGVSAVSPEVAHFAFARVGDALALAVRAAAPVALALALAGVALGLLGRASPSFQRAALMLPVRATLGLVLVLLGFATLAAALAATWDAWPGPVFDLWPGAVTGGP
jgi:flagellar biosynthesis protein FliR